MVGVIERYWFVGMAKGDRRGESVANHGYLRFTGLDRRVLV